MENAMATLYVENFPDELYAALRKRAKERRSSIAAEITALVKQNVPTESELNARRDFLKKLSKIHKRPVPANSVFPSAEILREDRNR
jgi:plasmid stability protein